MENSRQYGRRGVSMGNIIGDPFALATISISAVSKKTLLDSLKASPTSFLSLRHHLPVLRTLSFPPPTEGSLIDEISADIALAGMGDIFHLFYHCSDPDRL